MAGDYYFKATLKLVVMLWSALAMCFGGTLVPYKFYEVLGLGNEASESLNLPSPAAFLSHRDRSTTCLGLTHFGLLSSVRSWPLKEAAWLLHLNRHRPPLSQTPQSGCTDKSSSPTSYTQQSFFVFNPSQAF